MTVSDKHFSLISKDLLTATKCFISEAQGEIKNRATSYLALFTQRTTRRVACHLVENRFADWRLTDTEKNRLLVDKFNCGWLQSKPLLSLKDLVIKTYFAELLFHLLKPFKQKGFDEN